MAQRRTILGPMPCIDCGTSLLLVEAGDRNSAVVAKIARQLGYVPPRSIIEADTRTRHRHAPRVVAYRVAS